MLALFSRAAPNFFCAGVRLAPPLHGEPGVFAPESGWPRLCTANQEGGGRRAGQPWVTAMSRNFDRAPRQQAGWTRGLLGWMETEDKREGPWAAYNNQKLRSFFVVGCNREKRFEEGE